MAVGGSVSVGEGVSLGAMVNVGRDATVAVSVGSGRDVFVTPKVAVTTIITGERQSHCFSGSAVSVGVSVTVAVAEGVGVILGVKVGVLVFNVTNVGSSGAPFKEMYIEDAMMMRKSEALLISPNVKGNLRFWRRLYASMTSAGLLCAMSDPLFTRSSGGSLLPAVFALPYLSFLPRVVFWPVFRQSEAPRFWTG